MTSDYSTLSVKAIIERFLLLWLILLGIVAYCWTTWLPGLWDPFVGTEPYNKYVFSVTMLAIGSLLPRDEVREVLRRWPLVLGGTAVQFTAMPLLAYGCGVLFGLDEACMIGIIIVGCVPGAMASNVLTLAAKGNVSYSVSLTTSATLLSPVVVPLVLYAALSGWVPIDPVELGWKVFWISVQLLWMVVLPVIIGYIMSRCFAFWEEAAKRFAAIIANLTILWIIAVVIGAKRDMLDMLTWQVFLALLMVNLLGYLAGALGGTLLRLRSSMRRALTLEVGMQNAGLGVVLAGDFFKEFDLAVMPPVIYTFGCMFTGTLLARLWAEFGANEEANDDSTTVKTASPTNNQA